ncbi:hypothetical protein N3930_46005, partial [Bacillus thuringiensis]|nr:hypothetical protein [Bacillus thuringiensis]
FMSVLLLFPLVVMPRSLDWLIPDWWARAAPEDPATLRALALVAFAPVVVLILCAIFPGSRRNPLRAPEDRGRPEQVPPTA